MSDEMRLRRLEELRRLDAWLLVLTPFQRWQVAMIGALVINLLINGFALLAPSGP